MKVSFIVTVFNEAETIKDFLASLASQSRLPDEIIIVDGGSTDNTLSIISNFQFLISKKNVKIVSKKGNRSVGRNEAIKKAANEIVVCSDAGCILDKNWVKNIIKPFEDLRVDVVAGYYRGKPKNIFEKCLIPYVLVMSDKVKGNSFFPATRSMAFKKSIWRKAGGFDEEYSHNEDYVFAHKLKDVGANIVFEKKAIVNWIPRKDLKSAFKMFFRFAFGDANSGIFRPKVFLLFTRYLFASYILLMSHLFKSRPLLLIFGLLFISYLLWSIFKNYKYVKKFEGIIILPIIQITSDCAVMIGTALGFLRRFNVKRIYEIISSNKLLSLIIGLYVVLMIALINWGIPNKSHPFDYFMDEWHQAQAVRSVFSQGSPNVAGSANGSMFHFLLSGLFLVPFVITGIINPFAIGSSVEALDVQQKLFQILRLNTLFFGVSSIILIAYVAKKYFRLNPLLISFLFVVNPIWIMLSNYFKYDIALIFWIVLSFLLILKYSIKSTFTNYSLAAFVSGLAFSVKVSALPLLPVLLVSSFLFVKNRKIYLAQLGLGILIFFLTFLVFGVPDLLFGKGNINEYIYDNLVRTPNYTSNYILGANYISYLVFTGTSTVFGYFLFILSVISLFFVVGYLLKNKFRENINKRYLIIIISLFVFIISLIFLKIEARGNRLLVLLPFMVLLSGIFLHKIFSLRIKYLRRVIFFALILFCAFQLIESLAWVNLKIKSDLRQNSSVWIAKNIPSGSTIGVENIPIYQFLPDLVLKEFYIKQHNKDRNTSYNYKVVDGLSITDLPEYVIVTNGKISTDYFKYTPKKLLIGELKKLGYRNIFISSLDFSLLKLFRNERDYFMSGLIQSPVSINVYKK
ncbi:MAG: glycosyltransferase [Candidatus Levybacteria bacterium]|nr:glycosyltransferase [Candidatus Levybacteria bacterium]